MKTSRTLFDQLEIEKSSWLGTNDELLTECVALGNNLIKENKDLEETDDDLRSYARREIKSIVARIGVSLVLLSLAVWGILATVRSENHLKEAALAYRQGQIDVLSSRSISYEKYELGYKLREDASRTIQFKYGDKIYTITLEE
jgi:ABC-type amino acid transport substrate-binding protein